MLLGQVLEVSALVLWSAFPSIQSTSQCWTDVEKGSQLGDRGKSLGDPDCIEQKLECKLPH